jgi:hypothetical protein
VRINRRFDCLSACAGRDGEPSGQLARQAVRYSETAARIPIKHESDRLIDPPCLLDLSFNGSQRDLP